MIWVIVAAPIVTGDGLESRLWDLAIPSLATLPEISLEAHAGQCEACKLEGRPAIPDYGRL